MGLLLWKLFVCTSVCILYSSADDDLIITLPVGSIRGLARKTVTGTPYYSFLDIPFAEPPINELRFLAPVEKRPWTGILDGTKQKRACFQLSTDTSPSGEDCLFVNVFTPRKPSKSKVKLPVMFFMYGGGFIEGYSSEQNYGPHHLMEKDVILVTSNYRTGAFGFLSTGDLVIPGNAGLKDQNLALKWTKKYISYFGGDPSKITIFGQSAGAAAVGLHIVSPLSAGLFRAAISESGSVICPWAYQRRQKDVTFKLVEYVDKKNPVSVNSSKELLEYLQKQPAEVVHAAARALLSQTGHIFYKGYIAIEQGIQFAPVIEVQHEGAFLTNMQYESLKSGNFNHVPWLAGFAAAESLFYLDEETWRNTAKNLDTNPELLIPTDMNVSNEHRTKVAKKIGDFYTNGQTFGELPRQLVAHGTDQSFIRPMLKQAELQSAYTNVYIYYWRYLGTLPGKSKIVVKGFSNDTRHGEELSYLFARNYGGLNTTDLSKYPATDVVVLKRFITLVTNFVKELNPTPEPLKLLQNITWPSYGSKAHYLDIGSYLAVRQYPLRQMHTFWEKLYNEYGVPPYYTY